MSAGSPIAQLVESARTIASARSCSPWRSRIVGSESRADLLLALDEDGDPHRQVTRVGAQRRDVRHDTGLVVGGAAAVEPPAPLGRLEGRAVPEGVVAGRLHVVVRVEHDRARAGWAFGSADDGGPPALADDLDLEALGAQERGGGLGARLDVRLVEGVEADAGDAGQGLEVGADGRHECRHALAEGRDLVGREGVAHPWDPTDGLRPQGVGGAAACTASVLQRLEWGPCSDAARPPTSKLTEDALHPERDGAKNRPTPRRKDQEAARRQPLVVADRKQAKKLDRAKRNEQMAKTRQAMLTGDDSGLPPRDKGPVRRYMRDFIDARCNLAEFMLPVMLIVLALSFVRTSTILFFVTILTYSILLAAAVDTFLMWRKLRKRLVEKFGAEAAGGKGNGMYAAMRAFQLRRSRMPRSLVKRGEYPT